MANNYVEKLEDFEHLTKLLELSVLDLSNNHIEDPLIVEVLGQMPELRVVNLMGNPIIRKIPAYRKTMILSCKNLRYLDDRPVFPRERACAEAWERGGIAEENAERKRWIDRERQKIMDSVNALMAIRERHIEARRQQQPDSGQGTSLNDSESEPDSLNCSSLNVPPNEAVGIQELSEDSSTSDGEPDEGVPGYNYARECENDDDDSSDTSSDSDENNPDDFMKDRQTSEDYSEYRENIFEFSPRVARKRRLLLEEIRDQPSTSGLQNKVSKDASEKAPKKLIEKISLSAKEINSYDGKQHKVIKQSEDEKCLKSEESTEKEQIPEPSNIQEEARVETLQDNDVVNIGVLHKNKENLSQPQIKKDGWFAMEIGNMETTQATGIDLKRDQFSSSKSNIQEEPGSESENIDNEMENFKLKKQQLIEKATNEVRRLDFTNTTLTFDELMNGTKEIGIVENELSSDNQHTSIIETHINESAVYNTLSENESSDIEELTVGESIYSFKAASPKLKENAWFEMENEGMKPRIENPDKIVEEPNENNSKLEDLDEPNSESEYIEDNIRVFTKEGSELVEEQDKDKDVENDNKDLILSEIVEHNNSEYGDVKNEKNTLTIKKGEIMDTQHTEKTIDDYGANESSLESSTFDEASKTIEKTYIEEMEQKNIVFTSLELNVLIDYNNQYEGTAGDNDHGKNTNSFLKKLNSHLETEGEEMNPYREEIVLNEQNKDIKTNDIAFQEYKTDENEEFFEAVEFLDEFENEEGYFLNILYNNWSLQDDENGEQKMYTGNNLSEPIANTKLSNSPLTDEVGLNQNMVKVLEDDVEENEEELSLQEVQELVNLELAKLTQHQTIQDILRENSSQTDEEESEADENMDGDDVFYKKLDNSDCTKYEAVAKIAQTYETLGEETISTKEKLKRIFSQNTPIDEPENQEYKEIMEWNIEIPTENIQILKPIQRNKPGKPVDELSEMIAQSVKESKPEFEDIPPKDIAEKDDVILYPSSSGVKYKSIFTECGIEIKKEDIKPPMVYKSLTGSSNFPIFQMNDGKMVENDMPEDEVKVENSVIMRNKISEVREQLADFSKNLEDFRERARVAREVIIKDYNETVEKEMNVIDKLMLMKDKIFEKKSIKREPRKVASTNIEDLDDNTFRKHFEDMGVDILEDDDFIEEELNEEMRKSKEEFSSEVERIRKECLEKLEEESVSEESEEDERELIRNQLMSFIHEESNKNGMGAIKEVSNETVLNDGTTEELFFENNEEKYDSSEKEENALKHFHFHYMNTICEEINEMENNTPRSCDRIVEDEQDTQNRVLQEIAENQTDDEKSNSHRAFEN